MTDVEPRAPYPGAPSDQTKQGGLKDQSAKPQPEDDTGEADVETEEDAHGGEGGGMIGEG
jgi:hypothetical protein